MMKFSPAETIAALVDRVEVNKNYEVKVFFKVSAKQFLGKVVRIA